MTVRHSDVQHSTNVDSTKDFFYDEHMEVNEQKLEEILTEQRKEYQTYLGTLAEDFQSQTKLIAESVSGIQQQLEAILAKKFRTS